MHSAFSQSAPLVLVQTLGLVVIVVAFWFFTRIAKHAGGLALATGGAALIAYAPFVSIGTLLALGPGPRIYSGLVALAVGVLMFTIAVLRARRLIAFAAFGPMAAVASWTYFLLAMMISGL